MAVVEVRQPTLGGAGRGWGPAANTGLGWPWLRSGSQHLARMAVVEVRRQEEARRRRRRRRRKEEAAALIKSNNPHRAGGEKQIPTNWCSLAKLATTGLTRVYIMDPDRWGL